MPCKTRGHYLLLVTSVRIDEITTSVLTADYTLRCKPRQHKPDCGSARGKLLRQRALRWQTAPWAEISRLDQLTDRALNTFRLLAHRRVLLGVVAIPMVRTSLEPVNTLGFQARGPGGPGPGQGLRSQGDRFLGSP